MPDACPAARCDVYLARLAQLAPHHASVLDERETQRRTALRIDADRRRFTLAAVLLRAVVAERTGVAPARVRVDRHCDHCGAAHGRPRLTGHRAEVSISHAGDVVAVAVTCAGPVGVDVEVVTPQPVDTVLPLVCTEEERRHVREDRDFYAYWTRKEAVLKAMGSGLRTPMTDVVVGPPSSPPVLTALGSAGSPPCRMADVIVDEGHVGAVAVLTACPLTFAVRDGSALLAGL